MRIPVWQKIWNSSLDHLGCSFSNKSYLYDRQKSSSSFWNKDALNSGGGLTRDLHIADWLMSRSLSFKKQESRNCKMYSYLLALMFPFDKKVTHNVKPCATRKSRAWTQRGYAVLWARRGWPFAMRHGWLLARRRRSCGESKKDIWSCLECFFPSMLCTEHNCTYWKSQHSQFRLKTLTSWNKEKPIWTMLEERCIDDCWEH